MSWIAATLAIVIAFVVGYAALTIRDRRRKERLQAERKDDDVQSFVASFADTDVPRHLIELAYADIFDLAGVPPRRFDGLEKTFGIVDWDFEDLLAQRLSGMGVDDVLTSPYRALLPIWTPDDYVRLLAAIDADRGGT